MLQKMKQTKRMKYCSRWDSFTWGIIIFTITCCLLPLFFDDGVWPVIIAAFFATIEIAAFKSIYYCIEGDKLIVHQLFMSKEYPISKITEIIDTPSVLSAPATSLFHRIAVYFSDVKTICGNTPLVISPADKDSFIKQLQSINPTIKH